MKKYIVTTLLLLVVSFGLYSQEKVQFYSFGEFAYYPRLVDTRAPLGTYFSTKLGVGISYKFLYAEAEQFVNIIKATDFQFTPYKEQYFIRVGVQFSAIKIQFEHVCLHDVGFFSGYGGGHDQISISFDTRYLTKQPPP